MNLPGFLAPNKPQPTTEQSDTRERTAASGWEAIQSLIDERNKLRTEFQRIEADYAELYRAYTQNQTNLASERARADHYERFSTEIVVQFNTLRMVIDDIQKRCVDVAYKRLAPTPRAVDDTEMSEEDKTRMEALAKQLAPQTLPPEVTS